MSVCLLPAKGVILHLIPAAGTLALIDADNTQFDALPLLGIATVVDYIEHGSEASEYETSLDPVALYDGAPTLASCILLELIDGCRYRMMLKPPG